LSALRVQSFAVSIDGFGAGPDQDLQNPLGVNGPDLMEWFFNTRSWRKMHGLPDGETGIDDQIAERGLADKGAWILGRNMFGPIRGRWPDDSWKGWWGDEPPYHTPVFVLTHHARPSIEMEGGNVFHFVDASPQEALDLAREAAGDLDVRIGGGPTVIRDFLAADLIDALHVVQVPILLGRGGRLWDGLEGIEERYDREAVSSPSGVTHLTFTRR
jgi:dihydrofolate reductase